MFCFSIVLFCRQGCALLLCELQRKQSSSDVGWYTTVQHWGLPALVLQPGRKIFPLIVESKNGLGWEGPYRSVSSNPPAMGSETFHRASCSEPYPTWTWTLLAMGHPPQEAKIICTSTALGKKIWLRNQAFTRLTLCQNSVNRRTEIIYFLSYNNVFINVFMQKMRDSG